MRPLFGDLLRRYRLDAGVTLTSLAHRLDLQVPYLSDVERNQRPPLTRERIMAAAAFLSCGPELLLAAAARNIPVIPEVAFPLETEAAIGTFLLNIETMTQEQWQKIADIAGDQHDENDARQGAAVVKMRPNQKLKEKRERTRARANPDSEVTHVARPPARHGAAGRRN